MKKDKDYWIAFSAFPPIGPKKFKLLRKYFGSAKKAWGASPKELLEIGFSEKLVEQFDDFRKKFNPASYFLRLEKLGIETLIVEDKDYPENLKNIDDAPFLLYIIGDLKPQDCLSLAVVGTRKITSYGRQVTESLVADLVASGLTVVSGLAYGVDSVGHNSALQNAGRTIGVWAGGLDSVRPGYRQNLVEKILGSKQGVIVSEFPLDFHPSVSTFPQRNRIIAGLSLGVLVTEAAEDSGSLITANFAQKQGRPVFAVPGPITSRLSKGTADLIKNGAKLVYNVQDILDELDVKSKVKSQKSKEILPESKEEALVLGLLKDESKHIDEIARELGMAVAKIASLLTLMEMRGKVKNLGGMVYGLVH